ncbi:MAG: ABC transporter permease [Caldisericaceae bacterium]
MSKFINLFKKDLKELVTIELIIPLLIMVALFSFIGGVMSNETKKAAAPQSILVIDNDNSNLSRNLVNSLSKGNLIPQISSTGDMQLTTNYAKEKGISVILQIPAGFEQEVFSFRQPEVNIYSIMQSFSITRLTQSAQVDAIFSAINDSISSQFISDKFQGVSPEVVKNPVKSNDFVIVKDKTVEISPAVVSQAFMSQNIFIPIILAFVILYSSQMLASLIANEKQNKTLETILTVPIKRSNIVISKMLSSGVVALIISVLYLFGMKNYMGGVSGGEIGSSQYAGVLAKVGLTFTAESYVLLGLSTFLAIIAALAVTTILAVYAEDVKGAQAMLAPLMVLLLIPYFLTLFTDPNTLATPLRIILYAIPFSQPFLASQNLLFGRTLPVVYGIVYEIIFSVVCVIIATGIFSSDKILTAKVRLWKGIKFR